METATVPTRKPVSDNTEIKTVILNRHIGQYLMFAISQDERRSDRLTNRIEHSNGSWMSFTIASAPVKQPDDDKFYTENEQKKFGYVPSIDDLEVLISALRLLDFKPGDLYDEKRDSIELKFSNTQILRDLGLESSGQNIRRVNAALRRFFFCQVIQQGEMVRTVEKIVRGKRTAVKNIEKIDSRRHPVSDYVYTATKREFMGPERFIRDGVDGKINEEWHILRVSREFLLDCIERYSLRLRHDRLLRLNGSYSKALLLLLSTNTNHTFSESALIERLRLRNLPKKERTRILKRIQAEMVSKEITGKWDQYEKNGETYHRIPVKE